MNRKRLRKVQAEFARRGGVFSVSPDAPGEIVEMFLRELMDCPDCRAVILDACNARDHKDVDIDAVLRTLALREH